MSSRSVLCVSPDDRYRTEVGDLLADALDASVTESDSIREANEILERTSVDCVVTPLWLSDGTGPELFERVRELAPDTGCILFTAADTDSIRGEISSAYLGQYVDRNCSAAEERLVQLVEAATELHSHTAYPHPPNERDRLAALRRLDLSSPPVRSALKRLTTLAEIHFEVPQVSVNIVTEHTVEHLVSAGAEWGSVPRERSICTYNILTDDPTVIGDAFSDPRFAENGILRDLEIRFYAGTRLMTEDGLPIGTLCIYDEIPHDISEGDERILQLLADEISEWLIFAHDDPTHRQTVSTSGDYT